MDDEHEAEHLAVSGVEWDELEDDVLGRTICVFVPAAASAQLAAFLRTRCGEGRAFVLFDPGDPGETVSRWEPRWSEPGAFYFDDDNRLVIPAPRVAACELARALDAGQAEVAFGEVRIRLVG